MFEALSARIERLAEARTRARREALAESLAGTGVRAEADARGVLLSGKGLRRRIAGDAALRWLIAGLGR